MLSEDHTLICVLRWFNEFVSLFQDIPDVFISDMSTVLLNAAAKSFGGCRDVSDYIDWLFNTLTKTGKDSRKIKCYIRIDVAHLVKNITICDALKSKQDDQREFFIRATCLLIKCISIVQAEKILRSILIVAKSYVKGETFITHKMYLDQLISNDDPITDVNSKSNEYQKEVGVIFDDESIPASSSVNEWLTEIDTSTSLESADNGIAAEANNFMNPGFVKYLMRLSQTLVIWSAVAAAHFNAPQRASSAHVECYFKHLKKSLQPIAPGRVDEVVVAHIELIEGMIKSASQGYIEFVDTEGGLKKILNDKAELLSAYNKNSSNESDSHSRDDSSVMDKSESISISKCIAGDDLGVMDSVDLNPVSHCVACTNGDMPTGAHRCCTCSKPIHLFDDCSVDIGGEEGFGQCRKCISCAKKDAPKQQTKRNDECNVKKIVEQLQETEKWGNKPKSKSGSYLSANPNWNIDKKKMKGKPKIGHLLNGNLSTTMHTVNKKKVAVRNTCAFDSICQVNEKSIGFYCGLLLAFVDEMILIILFV